MAFLTALYGLADLAGICAGEWSRTCRYRRGGYGGRAARSPMGGGSLCHRQPRKWQALRAIGFDEDHIGDSRTLEFEDKFLAVTEGRGVDMVLNSLAGEFVDASLRLLVHGGRFIELGKTDIREAQAIATHYPGVRYRAFDLSEAGPQRIAAMLCELRDLFDTERLEPLPVTTWDVRCAERHIGS